MESLPCIKTGDSEFNALEGGGMTYGEYLQLDKLLGCQRLLSEQHQNMVEDEHLFEITHQAYELWFKQILFDLDCILNNFRQPHLEESQTLYITSRLERIVKIMKLLVDQILILETMSPLDFFEFRKYLAPASGFQSVQFRLLENKIGIKPETRIAYNQQYYRHVFNNPKDAEAVQKSEEESSLLELVDLWLQRTPGLEEGGYHFWEKYTNSVNRWLLDLEEDAKAVENPTKQQQLELEVQKTRAAFETILNRDIHEQLLKTGDRKLSHKALQGALIISFHRNEPRFSQPYQILSLLMDFDSLLTKWRYNHVLLVQRMLGSKQGTGGSSGYHYLRSTCSDRYKVFVDLFNLSTWLIPEAYVPPLTRNMHRKLSYVGMLNDISEDLQVKMNGTSLHL